MGRKSRWKKSLEVWETEMSGPAWDRWMEILGTRAKGTRREYMFHLRLFLDYVGMSPQELYEKRREDLLNKDDDFAEQEIETKIKALMADMQKGVYPFGKGPDMDKKYASATAGQTAKAVDSFLGSINKKYKLNLDRYELPQGNGKGRTGARPDMILEMWRQPGEAKLRNRAIITFQKDSGIRIIDMSLISVGFYREMRRQARFNDRGEPFLVFDPVRTIKEGIIALIHIGPEAVEDVDLYLKKNRPNALDDEPLFAKWEKRRPGYRKGIDCDDPWMNSNTVSQMFIRLGRKVEQSGYSIGAHTLRKFHKVAMQRAGLNEKWIRLLQGKATDTYDVPEPDDLLQAYMQAYDNLRIKQKPMDRTIQEQQYQIQAMQRRIQDLEGQLNAQIHMTDYTLGRLDEAGVPVAPGDPVSYRRQLKIDVADAILEGRNRDAKAILDELIRAIQKKFY